MGGVKKIFSVCLLMMAALRATSCHCLCWNGLVSVVTCLGYEKKGDGPCTHGPCVCTEYYSDPSFFTFSPRERLCQPWAGYTLSLRLNGVLWVGHALSGLSPYARKDDDVKKNLARDVCHRVWTCLSTYFLKTSVCVFIYLFCTYYIHQIKNYICVI